MDPDQGFLLMPAGIKIIFIATIEQKSFKYGYLSVFSLNKPC